MHLYCFIKGNKFFRNVGDHFPKNNSPIYQKNCIFSNNFLLKLSHLRAVLTKYGYYLLHYNFYVTFRLF